MINQTNTNGVDFIMNTLQGGIQSNSNSTGGATSNAVDSLPTLMGLDPQNALQQTARQPGGSCFAKGANAAYIPPGPLGTIISNTNAGTWNPSFEIRPSKLGTTKSGGFFVQMNGTNAVTVPLTNTATNTNGTVGDTVFATWYQIKFANLTGLGIDNTNSASATVSSSNTNGANLGFQPVNANGGYTIAGGGGTVIQQNFNGVTINASQNAILITPTGSGMLYGEICGA